MKTVRLTPAGLRVEDTVLGGAGVVVRVASAGICGTDVAYQSWPFPGERAFTLGHEAAGHAGGRPYALRTTLNCERCDPCRTGHANRCVGGQVTLGIFTDGAMTEELRVPERALVPLPDGLDPRDGCLVEPAAVARHGVARARVGTGDRVAVVGGGSIGLLAVATLRAQGHDVDLLARHDHQTAAGRRLGAGRVDGEYDVLIEAAGTASAVADCARLARPGARVVLLGVYPGDIPVPGVRTLTKELAWIASFVWDAREFAESARMLAADPGIAATVITHRFPLAEAREAFRVAGDRSAGAIKVVLHP